MMEIGTSPSLGLLSIVLFLLPGLAGIKLGLRIAERGDWLNRLETTGLSFGLSLAAMLVIYLLVSLYQSYHDWSLGLLTYAEIRNFISTIPNFIYFYLLLVALSLIGGYLLGVFDFGGNYFSPILPWAKFHQIAERSGDGETYVVRVRTMAGEELRGKVEDEGEAALNKDIILDDPLKIRFGEDSSIVEQRSWTGYAYIHSQSIAHVEFDRLEDADASEIQAYERWGQQTLEDASRDSEAPDTDADHAELDELEALAEKGQDETNQQTEQEDA